MSASVLRGPFCDCGGAPWGPVVRCPRLGEPGVECVPRPPEVAGPLVTDPAADHPLVRYRGRMWSYGVARRAGLDAAAYVDLVTDLDGALAAVAGTGLAVTPVTEVDAGVLDDAVIDTAMLKDETRQPAGSHKIRHLFGLAVHLRLAEITGGVTVPPLAVASCGNAALAAAVMARAAGWRLEVFVPEDADPAVLDLLAGWRATVTTCARRPGEAGDPCIGAQRRAVAEGALPFGVQGPENALTLDGARTIGFELAERAAARARRLDHVVVQVGGGALAAATMAGLDEAWRAGALAARPRYHAVQTDGAAPLARAAEVVAARAARLGVGSAMAWAVRHRDEVMRPWERTPRSVAGGLLDDETYDWAAVVDGVLSTGGSFPVLDDAALLDGRDRCRAAGIDASPTGAAGLAALDRIPALPGETVAVIITGAAAVTSP
jgi:threonine synthase